MSLRIIALLLWFTLPLLLTSQVKDIRAELYITFKSNDITVSPQEGIWFCSNGSVYRTESIDSLWHLATPMMLNHIPTWKRPKLSQVSFFDNRHVMITGYIENVNKGYNRSGYYYSSDKGKNWDLKDFGTDSWIYNVFILENGLAWMGGSSGDILYSENKGIDWKKLNSPFDSDTRVLDIFMLNKAQGIAGAQRNRIYITENNWQSSDKIETPFDQKKYIGEYRHDSAERISKIRVWGEFLVVNQNGRIFYTKKSDINWRQFDLTLLNFEVDQDSNKLYAVNSDLEALEFDAPKKYQPLNSERVEEAPKEILVVKGSVYINGKAISKWNREGVIHNEKYTRDWKIREPPVKSKKGQLTLGANDKHLYISEGDNKEWHRIDVLDFNCRKILILSDNEAILWDGTQNYLYNLKTKSYKDYRLKNPIEKFLGSEIKSMQIESIDWGCFHSFKDRINYGLNASNQFEAVSYSAGFKPQTFAPEESVASFESTIDKEELVKLLQKINLNPYYQPSLSDFDISEQDRVEYIEMVKKRFKEPGFLFDRKDKGSTKSYISALESLDTLSNATLRNAIQSNNYILGGNFGGIELGLVNMEGDTLKIKNSSPRNLPWEIEFKGLQFKCYRMEIPQIITECLPENFLRRNQLHNKYHIWRIAAFLNERDE